MRVVLVLSYRHSGSTLIGDVLGAAEGALFVGESHDLTQRLAWGRRCTCGQLLRDCPTLAISFTGPKPATKRFAEERDPMRSLKPFVRAIVQGRPTALSAPLQQAADVQKEFWLLPREGVHTVIDSSKTLPLAVRHAQDPDVDLTVVYVRRDARDAVNSSLRRGTRKKSSSRRPVGLRRSGVAEGIRWWLTGRYVHRVLRRTGVRIIELDFEDWSADPDTTVPALASALGLEIPIHDRVVDSPPRHLVWGNSDRIDGPIEIRRAERGRSHLTPAVRLYLVALNRLG